MTLRGEAVIGCNLPFLGTTPHVEFKARFSNEGKTADELFHCLEHLFPAPEAPAGTEFQQAVWRAIQMIPRGETRTYGEIAAMIGHPGAVRAVGTACGANPLPLFIPCHRVVAKNGLGGYGSGLPWKRLLIQLEQRRHRSD